MEHKKEDQKSAKTRAELEAEARDKADMEARDKAEAKAKAEAEAWAKESAKESAKAEAKAKAELKDTPPVTVDAGGRTEMAKQASAVLSKEAVEADMLARAKPDARKFRVTVRHSPLPVKSLDVMAANEDEAFMEFCRANKVRAEEIARQQNKRRPTFESPLPGEVGFFAQNRKMFDVTIKEVA